MAGNLPIITVVVPHRMTEDASVTLLSLAEQSFKEFNVITVPDQGKGANWARNEGFKSVHTEFVLFSDNDIQWKIHALETLLKVLRLTKASYSYGRYDLGGKIWGHEVWNPYTLKHHNYVSTMSLIRSADFPGFDENINRFQDWDLWLTMLAQGKRGAYCNDLIFSTPIRAGITNTYPLEPAIQAIIEKHGLDMELMKVDLSKS